MTARAPSRSGWAWVLVFVLAVLVVGLIVFARGPEHSRGTVIDGSRGFVFLSRSF